MKKIRLIPILGVTGILGAFAAGFYFANSPGTGGPASSTPPESAARESSLATMALPSTGAPATEAANGAPPAQTPSEIGADPPKTGPSLSILGTSPASSKAFSGDRSYPPLTDPKEVERLVRTALDSLDPLERRRAFDQLLLSVDSENLQMIRSALHRNGAGPEEWRLFDYAAGAEDPAAIADILTRINEQHQNGYLQNTIPGWASSDPDTAIAYVASLEASPFKDRLTNRMIEGLAVNDLSMATDYVLGLASEGSEKSGQYVQTLAGEVFRAEGIDGAPAWLSTLPEGTLQNAATGEIASAYVKQKGEAVLPWLASLDPGPARSQGYQEAFHTWAQKNLETATGQLNHLPPSPDRDHAIIGTLGPIMRTDPASAEIWANQIQDATLRQPILAQLRNTGTEKN